MAKPRWILGLVVLQALSGPLVGWAAEGGWTPTGVLGTGRYAATATLLPTGKVLIAGGYSGESGYLTSAELYDQATGSFTPTGSLGTARSSATATLLPTGKVLIVGGFGEDFSQILLLASAELYDPATGSFTATGSLADARWGHTATLLPTGKVLIAGGQGEAGTLA